MLSNLANNMVGINNAAPQYTLDVSGNIRSSNLHAGPVYSSETGVLYNNFGYPYHIVDMSSSIPFTNTIFVFEVARDTMLPNNKYDGYVATLINKSGAPITIRSSEPMFNIFQLPPDGGNLFVLDENRRIDLLYTKTPSGSSWSF